MDMIPQDNTPRKQCTGPCGQFLPNTTQFFHRNGKDKLYPKCKECKGKQAKDRYANPEVKVVILASRKAYRQTPQFREHRQAYDKAYYSQPEKREQKNTTTRNYKRVHYSQPEKREQRDTTNRVYRNRPEVRAHNQELDRTRQHNRNARIKGNGGSHTSKQIQEQFQRQKGKCYYCKDKMVKYHVEHVVPIARGGSNDISNIVLACPTCNHRKNDRMPHEWPEGGRLL